MLAINMLGKGLELLRANGGGFETNQLLCTDSRESGLSAIY